MRRKPDVSIVIPMFNEAGNVIPLVTQILDQIKPLLITFEILLVDDGSQDSTWNKIEAASSEYNQVFGLKLSRNFGHQHALIAGLNLTKGDAIISMDADLQHPPSVLPKLIERWRSGSKIVYTKRHSSKHTSAFKRTSSNVFYKLFSWLTGVSIGQGSSDFRLIDRQVLTELIKFNDVDPFVRGAVRWLGYDQASSTVEFTVGERLSGESQYSLKKMISLANAAIVSFSTKPLIVAM
ncbi:MAG: glycosyltransferase family 2 protein [Motiliproteus sp.]